MKTEQINLRLETELVQMLENLAKEQAIDRATLMRKLLIEAIRSLRVEGSIAKYQEGKITIGRAAEEAGLTQWELLDELGKRHLAYPLAPSQVEARIDELKTASPRQSETGRGFRVTLQTGVGKTHSLNDIRPKKGGVLLVGINPAPISVEAGHYYQGRLGRRLWKRLESLGLLHDPIPGQEDEAFKREGHGLTDVVKRPTASSDELSHEELVDGGRQVIEKIQAWQPGVVLFAFKRAAQVVLGARLVSPGRGPEIDGVPTFLFTGPYAPSEDARKVDAEFKKVLRSLRRS